MLYHSDGRCMYDEGSLELVQVELRAHCAFLYIGSRRTERTSSAERTKRC